MKFLNLLSVSLGAAETTLLNLTSSLCIICKWREKIEPKINFKNSR